MLLAAARKADWAAAAFPPKFVLKFAVNVALKVMPAKAP